MVIVPGLLGLILSIKSGLLDPFKFLRSFSAVVAQPYNSWAESARTTFSHGRPLGLGVPREEISEEKADHVPFISIYILRALICIVVVLVVLPCGQMSIYYRLVSYAGLSSSMFNVGILMLQPSCLDSRG